MNLQDLSTLVARGESEHVEFKSSTGSLADGIKTVCAMLNSPLPGDVFFGVTDRGEIRGQDVTARTLEDVANELRRIDPPSLPTIETVPLESGRTVIVIAVSGGTGLYRYHGRPYHRVGPTTSVMPSDLYDRRAVERLRHVRRWENEPAHEDITIADLDEEEIRRTLANAIGLGRLNAPADSSVESTLRGLELIRDGHLVNAAVALYGKSPWLQIYYPQLEVRMARFRGPNRLADFDDNRQEWGHAFETLRRAERFLREHVPIAGRVWPDRLIREDRPRYPPRATREALANAICHRDYIEGGGAVTVAVYDDHLEIANPGSLHFGLTPEDLTRPHRSHPWNPLIAGAFYRAGIIERWGIGTLNILQWCDENSSPHPTWELQPNTVVINFLPARDFESGVESNKIGQVTGQVTGQVALRIFRFLNEPCRGSEIQEFLGLRHRETFLNNYLRPLIADGYIAMTVPDKPRSRLQRYRLTAKGKAWLSRQAIEQDRG
jgi:ATP-dependent DNA helicase RecG